MASLHELLVQFYSACTRIHRDAIQTSRRIREFIRKLGLRSRGLAGHVRNESHRRQNGSGTASEDFIEGLNSRIAWYNSGQIKWTLSLRTPNRHRKVLGYAV